jgi:hypothetical protein
LKADFTARGVEYLNTDYAAAGLLPDGTTAFMSTDCQRNYDHFEQLAPGLGPSRQPFLARIANNLTCSPACASKRKNILQRARRRLRGVDTFVAVRHCFQ